MKLKLTFEGFCFKSESSDGLMTPSDAACIYSCSIGSLGVVALPNSS